MIKISVFELIPSMIITSKNAVRLDTTVKSIDYVWRSTFV